ncbi:MAG TPA: hypothetical protein VJ733_10560, partial [Candidatus Binatia bacterium]|nr:hypothetical protein [Candidatus Binatia bacterium]
SISARRCIINVPWWTRSIRAKLKRQVRSERVRRNRKEYGFQKFYPEKGLTTEEYADRVEKWMRLMKEITRK